MDRTFGGSDWKQTLQDSLDASFKAKNESEALDVIDSMLQKLGECLTLETGQLTQGMNAWLGKSATCVLAQCYCTAWRKQRPAGAD